MQYKKGGGALGAVLCWSHPEQTLEQPDPLALA